MPTQNSFTFVLSEPQQQALIALLQNGNYRPVQVEHTRIAVEGNGFRVSLYKSGKCLVQGSGASDFVLFNMEPVVLQKVKIGYEDVVDPDGSSAHIGVDESGKGDFFGPLVVAAVYVTAPLIKVFREIGIKDSKRITSDAKARQLARAIRERVGDKVSVIAVSPRKYNELYRKMRNVNRMLAWGHARTIENVLEKAPDCPRALSDQFADKKLIERALLTRGKTIKLDQRHKAESDMAVAAASILARDRFLAALLELQERYGVKIPKGASALVKETALDLVRKHGPAVLLETVKCHFKTADEVLALAGCNRQALGPDGAPSTAKPYVRRSFKKTDTP
ncbi:MAG: ribonuclease HIII [Kiritimatiellia bacterium]